MSYLPDATGGHAEHVETGQVVNGAQSMLSETLMKIVSRWSAHHTRSSYQTKFVGASEPTCDRRRRRIMMVLTFCLNSTRAEGGSGPQRLIRALRIETGNPIMTYEQQSSFLPSIERAL